MRTVNVNELEPGMIVARQIYNEDGRCLINKDVTLTVGIIERIKKLDYDALKIKDENFEVVDYLSDELKMKTVRKIKSVYTGYSSKKVFKDMIKKMDELQNIVENVVDEIIKNKNCCVQLSDLKNFNNRIYEHVVDVSRIAVLIGVNMELRKDQLINLCLASMMHDIGKTQVSLDIINKSTDLTDKEMWEFKSHVNLGYNIARGVGFRAPVYMPIFQHHERYDGQGYPDHLIGERINLYARIIKIADTYCNMRIGTVNTNSYVQSYIIDYFNADNSKEFDPEILKIFLSKVPLYEVGQELILSTGKRALVIQNNGNCPARPIVKLIKDDKTLGEEIDLSNIYNITILK